MPRLRALNQLFILFLLLSVIAYHVSAVFPWSPVGVLSQNSFTTSGGGTLNTPWMVCANDQYAIGGSPNPLAAFQIFNVTGITGYVGNNFVPNPAVSWWDGGDPNGWYPQACVFLPNGSFILVNNKDYLDRFDPPWNSNQTQNARFRLPSYNGNQHGGIDFDSINGYFYMADNAFHRILKFPSGIGNTSQPLAIYGQSAIDAPGNILPNRGMPPSASTLKNPAFLKVDCNGGIWVSDTGNNRVLHFPFGQTTADVVLGQPDFQTVINSASTTFQSPAGITMNSNCSVLWVADSQKSLVHQFKASTTSNNFTTNQAPDGTLNLLGNTNPTSATFNPRGLAFVGSSQYLYIQDFRNNRTLIGFVGQTPSNSPSVSLSPSRSPSNSGSLSNSPSVSLSPSRSLSASVTATTGATPTASPSYSFTPSSSPTPSPSSNVSDVCFETFGNSNNPCFVNLIVAPNSTMDFSLYSKAKVIQVLGFLVIPHSSTVIVSSNQVVNISNCFQYSGNIVLNYIDPQISPTDSVYVTIFNYTCIQYNASSFDSVQVKVAGIDPSEDCLGVEDENYGSRSFGVLIGYKSEEGCGDGGGGVNTGLIVGVVLGVSVCCGLVVIIVIVASIVGIVVKRRYRYLQTKTQVNF